ncbi:CheR family methyltransferase [Natronoflexus pectinivorans]|uniref:protein-glutamate O-methyltransferase n=1 Tax=Natronoflexus pectinivorans TaxID=682526 RepID=A0A4R2GFA6_9BACT|nr:CheR family methyltransferase [Natronoflexus pectinivorans]TCO06826.1 chemotaxis protein methyltransferase CheR [Natronoflexus pectinivorans]
MAIVNLRDIYKAELSEEHFDKLARLIMNETGIKMPPVKRVMVQSRLKKRLRELNMSSFDAYVKYAFSDEGFQTEVVHIFDVISTNKTDFFREPVHFNFLRDAILPEFSLSHNGKTFKVWSAACSSGEEAVTTAMVINEFLSESHKFDYTIHGTDISTHILRMAGNGVYTEERVRPAVPENLLRKYFMKSKDPARKTYRVVPELRQKIKYSRLNFMDDGYNMPEKYDLIFCRNVLIYFDRPTQESVVNKLCHYLKPGGYIIHGHSESFIGMQLPLKAIRPTIFKKV